MDAFSIATEFLFAQVPQWQNMQIVDGHHRFIVWMRIALSVVLEFESMGWQFEPPTPEIDLWLSLL